MSREIRTKVACINWDKDESAPRAMTYQVAVGDDGVSEMLGVPQFFGEWGAAVDWAQLFWRRVLEGGAE